MSRRPGIEIVAPKDFLDKLDTWRAAQKPIPSRSAAIRYLCLEAMPLFSINGTPLVRKAATEDRPGGVA